MTRAWGAALLCLWLASCDAGPSAVPAREQTTSGSPTAAAGSPALQPEILPPSVAAPEAITPTFDGKPVWSSNRKMTAEENARSHFEKDGADFGAKSVEDFVAKAHAFTSKPPKGVQKIMRPNGDRLLYDPKTNVFAVVTRAGAPRTMFKPRNGAAYWEQQKEVEAQKTGAPRG